MKRVLVNQTSRDITGVFAGIEQVVPANGSLTLPKLEAKHIYHRTKGLQLLTEEQAKEMRWPKTKEEDKPKKIEPLPAIKVEKPKKK